jgi:glycosyltransferase involved in cell wall biosynthesis/O-antigen/teichoic acid export membrane protein
MTLAGVATGIGNLLFNVVVARAGGASAYGAIGALLGFTTAMAALAAGMQYSVARRAATGVTDPRELCRSSISSAWPLAALCLALLPLSIPAATYLRLSSPLPVVLSVLLFAWTVLVAVPYGILIGLGRFRLLAVLLTTQAILRLPAGAVMTRVIDPTTGALVASLMAPVVLGLVTFLVVLRLGSPHPAGRSSPARSDQGEGILVECGVGALYTAGLWAVWTLPLVLGRHALTHDQSGSLAAVQVLCGGIIFLCAPLLTALYPAIARHANVRTIATGLLATLGLGLAATVALTVVGPLFIAFLYGHEYVVGRGLVLVLATSATVTAAASYGLWIARALLRFQVSAGIGVAVALGTEVVLAQVGTSSSSLYAADPAVAISLGLIAAAGAERAGVRRRGRSPSAVAPADCADPDGPGTRLILLNWKDPTQADAGGAELYVRRIAELWASEGCEVTLFVPRVKGRPSREVAAGVQYVRKGSRFTVFRHARRHLRQHHIRYDRVLESVSTRPFHAHRVVGSRATALYHQTANEVWRQEFRFPVSWIGRHVVEPRWIAGMRGSRVISVSECTAADLRARGVSSVAVVPPGAPLPPPPRRRSGPSNAPRVVFIGRLSRTKRPLDAIMAFRLLWEHHPTATMDIVGDGYQSPQLERLIGPGITWHGRATDQLKNRILASADLVFLPGTREGWGIVALEAAGHGVPVVTYDVPGLREAVVDGVTGAVTAATPEAMAAAGVAILNQPARWAVMSRSARERAAQFTWESAASQVLRHLDAPSANSEHPCAREQRLAEPPAAALP